MRYKTLILLLSLMITSVHGEPQHQSGTLTLTKEQAENKKTSLDPLRLFAEAFNRIKLNYVEEIDDRVLIESAVRGMLQSLDPHSDLLIDDEYTDLSESTDGEYGGLGIDISIDMEHIKIISPIDDTPAKRAGVKTGDLIIRLDGKSVKGMTISEAVEHMRGEPGTKIILTVRREGVKELIEIPIVRDVIRIKSVKGYLLEDDLAYLRISNFQTGTASDLLERFKKLEQKSGKPFAGLILDLRNNPGGVLSAAVAVSDAFLTQGVIVTTRGRKQNAVLNYAAEKEDLVDGAPLVVIVNRGSASASEIVAGALQDHKRAVIIGERTFGKGSVQTIVPVNQNAAIKLTTARYYTPSGRSIQAEGITPDIQLESVKVNIKKESSFKHIMEKDLKGHLENDREGQTKAEPEKSVRKVSIEKDYVLYQALNLLKGMVILRQAQQQEALEDEQKNPGSTRTGV